MAANTGQQAGVHVPGEAAVFHQGCGPWQASSCELLGHLSGCEVGSGSLTASSQTPGPGERLGVP